MISQSRPAVAPAVGRWPASRSERASRALVMRLLSNITGGVIEFSEPAGRTSLGRQGSGEPLHAVIEVHDPAFYSRLLHGSVGLCDSYMDGMWDCDDLVTMTRIAALNVGSLDRLRRALAPVLVPAQRAGSLLARNTPGRSRRQIAAHYDLGNDLFEMFLDPTMMYSCAVFDSPQSTLEEASIAKLERICEKLDLGPSDHVVEIGSGWGGFAIHAASTRGCRVTTTTISREQYDYALERVRRAGCSDLVTVLLQDYRELRGSYDKLVSIEMIEAVGWEYLPTFFRCCSRLLREDGAMLLQAITIDDRAYEVEKAGRSFINTYIFPGGCLPSMQAISRSVAKSTDLRHVHMEDITSHYATTLAHWRERFIAGSERLAELGYDERFRRLWELYLSYCEGGFRERRIQDVQILFAKPDYRAEPLHAIAARPGADLAAA